MAEVTEHYDNLTERQEAIALYEGQGYRMLHDDFDADCTDFTNPYGTLTFTDEPSPVAPPPPAPPSFATFTHGLPDRVTHIEEFLKVVFP